MANDEYIKIRMQQWAEWVVMRESGAVGYPRECSYTRMQARSGSSGFHSPDIDMEAMEIEDAVRVLPDYLRLTVREYYVKPGTIEQKAKQLCCHRDTLYARIEQSHTMISGWLTSSDKKKS
jgi:hypothetical protein